MMAEKLAVGVVPLEGKIQSKRIASIDWMRGFVMILMVIDHASMAFNGEHFSADSAGLYVPGTEVAASEFITRWISHMCAPTFFFSCWHGSGDHHRTPCGKRAGRMGHR
jgi:uncharacterized membrane protein